MSNGPVAEAQHNQKHQFNNLITKTSKVSGLRCGNRSFDDMEELKGFAQTLLQCRIIGIRFWYGSYSPTMVINGIQVTYKNLDNWKVFKTTERYSYQLLQHGYHDIKFGPNELIQDVKARTGQAVDQLNFFTNKKRIISKGGKGGDINPFTVDEGRVIIGTYGATGACLQHIGFYTAPLREVRYWQKRSYILMKASVRKNKAIQDQIKKKVKDGLVARDVLAEATFVLLVSKGDQIFAQVMRFL